MEFLQGLKYHPFLQQANKIAKEQSGPRALSLHKLDEAFRTSSSPKSLSNPSLSIEAMDLKKSPIMGLLARVLWMNEHKANPFILELFIRLPLFMCINHPMEKFSFVLFSFLFLPKPKHFYLILSSKFITLPSFITKSLFF